MNLFLKILQIIEPILLAIETEYGAQNVADKHDAAIRRLTEGMTDSVPVGMAAEMHNAVNTLIHAGVEVLTEQRKLPAHTPPAV